VGRPTPITSRRCATRRYWSPPKPSEVTRASSHSGNLEAPRTRRAGASNRQDVNRLPDDARSRCAGTGCFQSHQRRALHSRSVRACRRARVDQGQAFGGRVKTRPALTAPARGSCEMGGRDGRTPAARSNQRTCSGGSGAGHDITLVDLIRGVRFDAVLRRERHVGEHILFCLVQKGGELGQLGSQLVGDLAPLSSGAFSVVLGEGGGNEGGDDAAPLAACMGKHIAHEVDAAALPSGVEHLGDGGFDALMSI
jgi:hypothetical protein